MKLVMFLNGQRYIFMSIIIIYMLIWIGCTHAESNINFHGTLVVVECSINAGQRQTVDFGSAVGIHRIDGKRYEQSIPFTLNCKNHSGGEIPPLILTIEGKPTSFNEAAILTNVKGLGIEIRKDGVAQELNKAITIDYKSLPVLTAVPVAEPSIELEASPFTATVKLTVEVP
ncbi:fimbrial protein [Salmonella enterica]